MWSTEGVLAHEVTRTGRIAAATRHALDEARLIRFAGDVDHDVSGFAGDVDHDVAAVSEGGIPGNSLAISVHHLSCSGRALLRRAASSDSKRASAMKRPRRSAGGRAGPPSSHPVAPGMSSWTHRSNAARSVPRRTPVPVT